jgi:beta-galactosidase
MDMLIDELGITPGPDVPEGMMARDIDDKHSLYLNPTDKEQIVRINGKAKGILTGKTYKDEVVIPPFEAEFIERP